jgi:regulatory protein
MAGTITALKLQARNKSRVNVYLDGHYAFSLADLVAAPLRVGQVLSDEDIAELQRQDAFRRAYERALNYLSYRARSRAEIERYLAKKQVDQETIEAVIARLAEVGLLNDADFARMWVENRENLAPRSRRMLQHELRQKGVAPEIIAEALEDLDEVESAYRAAMARVNRYARLDRPTFDRRLGGFLLRRGFSYEVVREVLNRVWRKSREGEA